VIPGEPLSFELMRQNRLRPHAVTSDDYNLHMPSSPIRHLRQETKRSSFVANREQ
jgi:hypothetical protein